MYQHSHYRGHRRRRERKKGFEKISEEISNKEVYSYTILPWEARKMSNKPPNMTPKATRERKTNKI